MTEIVYEYTISDINVEVLTDWYNTFRINRASLEELRMFLENEVWELCPVKASFSILLLQVMSESVSESVI